MDQHNESSGRNEAHDANAGRSPHEGEASWSTALGGVTPAGYHRGQNPKPPLENTLPECQFAPIPIHILDQIVNEKKDGVVVCDEIGFDYLTLTGRGHGHADAIELLTQRGFIIKQREKGTNWYRCAEDIEGGGVVAWDHRNNADSWMIELPGKQWMRDHESTREIAFDICETLDMRCTRLDIRRDQFGHNLTLIDHVTRACEDGNLCRARTFQRMDEHRAQSPASFTGRGFYLGSRSSDRFVRVYDKGLERGYSKARTWERFEAQLRGEIANKTWSTIAMSGEGWPLAAFDHLIASTDFRDFCRRHATIVERNRLDWWEAYCSGRQGVRPSTIRDFTDGERFIRWLANSVAPTLESVRQCMGLNALSEVVGLLETRIKIITAGGSSLAVADIVELIADTRST